MRTASLYARLCARQRNAQPLTYLTLRDPFELGKLDGCLVFRRQPLHHLAEPASNLFLVGLLKRFRNLRQVISGNFSRGSPFAQIVHHGIDNLFAPLPM